MLLAVAGDLTRRGEQTLLSVSQSFAVANGWRANSALCHVVARRGEQTTRGGDVTGFLSGSAIFNPKNPIFIQLNPKFDRKLNLWSFYNLNIIYLLSRHFLEIKAIWLAFDSLIYFTTEHLIYFKKRGKKFKLPHIEKI